MRCFYRISLKYLFLFISISLFTLIILTENSFAKGARDYSIEHSINATLYDDNQYSQGGKTLTATGINVKNWNYKDSKYLKVNIMVAPKQDEVHIVEVKLATPFYSVSDVTNVPSGFSRVEGNKSANIPINDGKGTYYVKNGCGTFKYYLKPNMDRATILLELRYDQQLWDKLGNSPLTPEGVAPITVSIGHENNTSNALLGQYSSMVYVDKVTSGERIMGDGCNYIKRNWYSNYWDADFNYYGYKDDLVALYIWTTNANRISINKYYKKVTIEINIPYCNIGGTRYYLDYDADRFVFENTVSGNIKAKILEATQSTIKFCIDDYYAVDDTPIYAYFKWPKELNTSREKVEFNGGSTIYKVISNANKEVIGFNRGIGKIVLDTRLYENVSVDSRNQNATIKKTPDNSVNRLGSIYINNLGTGNSTEKKVDIEFDKKQLVTSMRLPADTVSDEYDINYTLKNENGSKVVLGGKKSWTVTLKNSNYKKNVIDNIYVIFTRNMLPEQHKGYYIDSISYTIKSIKKRSYLFYEGDNKNGYECAGNIYGRLASSAKAGEKLYGKVTLTSIIDSKEIVMQHEITTTVTEKETASYGIINAKFSKSSIKAGEAVYTTGSLWSSQLFYDASCTWLHNMRFALLLPNGVYIDKKSIDVRTNIGDKKVSVTNIDTLKTDDNNTLWIIDLDKDVYMGYFSEELGVISSVGDRLNYSIRLVTDSNMEANSLNTDEMLFLAGTDIENMMDVSFVNFKSKDKWDLNKNGSCSDYIGCVESGYRQTCSIAESNLGLSISDKISIIGEGTVNINDATIKQKDDIIQYDLSIESKKDGTASAFEYYIPIVKKTSIKDDYLVTSDAKELFNMQLIEDVSITGDDIYKIEYLIKEGLTYNEVRKQDGSDWYTLEELENNNIQLKEVTFLRITVKGGTIEKGMDTKISLKMMGQGDKLYLDNKKYNEWKACGYYDFDDGKRIVSGHFSTRGVSATLDIEEPPINNIVISTGEQVNDDRVFYLYDIKGYEEAVVSEPIEFMVERNSDSDVITLAVSQSSDYGEKDKYMDPQLIKIYDENNSIVEISDDGKYSLKANKKYKIKFSNDMFKVNERDKEYVYLHSINEKICDVKRIILIRRSAFVQK